jgi:hypothetical protein
MENFKKIILKFLIPIVVIGLFGVYCYFLPEKSNDVHFETGIQIAIIAGVSFFLIFITSSFKKNSDLNFWNFTQKTVTQLFLALIFGGIFMGGISLALFSIDTLFGANINDKPYQYLACICFLFFSPIYFLANIPTNNDQNLEEIEFPKIWKILGLYILSPLLALYIVILYGYLFKIIFTWQLPNGWVSTLVSILSIGGLFVICLLFPLIIEKNNKLVNIISKYLGIIIFPLFILMSIGIFRRISDYGITINRLYVLILNIWFYGIYVYLFISKSRHIKWILFSFVAITFIISTGPWKISNIVKYSLTSKLNSYLNNEKINFSDTRSWLDNLDKKQKENAISSLRYLEDNYGSNSIQVFFADFNENSIYKFSDLIFDEADSYDNSMKSFNFYKSSNNEIDISKYTKFSYFEYYYYNSDNFDENIKYKLINNQLKIEIINDKKIFSIPLLKTAKKFTNNSNDNQDTDLIFSNENFLFLVENFYGYYYPENDSISISNLKGYLFYK